MQLKTIVLNGDCVHNQTNAINAIVMQTAAYLITTELCQRKICFGVSNQA